jgi:AraC family transcriptional regulator
MSDAPAPLTQRALWVIERHLHGDLSLPTIAQACGVSTFHLSRAFSEHYGRSLTDYVRGRRLSFAAGSLAGGAPDILDVALASGYGSHEAFTRAFKTALGFTPEEVRRRGTVDGLPLTAALDMTAGRQPSLAPPKLCAVDDRTFACLNGQFSFASIRDIPALWRRFMEFYPRIKDKLDPAPWAVMSAPDDDGAFEYACAVLIPPASELPHGLGRMSVRAHRYAVFAHPGHVSLIRATYEEIWDRALAASGWTLSDRPVLESHCAGFNPRTGDGGLEIWVPVGALVESVGDPSMDDGRIRPFAGPA